jgi:hypothetical protein
MNFPEGKTMVQISSFRDKTKGDGWIFLVPRISEFEGPSEGTLFGRCVKNNDQLGNRISRITFVTTPLFGGI